MVRVVHVKHTDSAGYVREYVCNLGNEHRLPLPGGTYTLLTDKNARKQEKRRAWQVSIVCEHADELRNWLLRGMGVCAGAIGPVAYVADERLLAQSGYSVDNCGVLCKLSPSVRKYALPHVPAEDAMAALADKRAVVTCCSESRCTGPLLLPLPSGAAVDAFMAVRARPDDMRAHTIVRNAYKLADDVLVDCIKRDNPTVVDVRFKAPYNGCVPLRDGACGGWPSHAARSGRVGGAPEAARGGWDSRGRSGNSDDDDDDDEGADMDSIWAHRGPPFVAPCKPAAAGGAGAGGTAAGGAAAGGAGAGGAAAGGAGVSVAERMPTHPRSRPSIADAETARKMECEAAVPPGSSPTTCWRTVATLERCERVQQRARGGSLESEGEGAADGATFDLPLGLTPELEAAGFLAVPPPPVSGTKRSRRCDDYGARRVHAACVAKDDAENNGGDADDASRSGGRLLRAAAAAARVGADAAAMVYEARRSRVFDALDTLAYTRMASAATERHSLAMLRECGLAYEPATLVVNLRPLLAEAYKTRIDFLTRVMLRAWYVETIVAARGGILDTLYTTTMRYDNAEHTVVRFTMMVHHPTAIDTRVADGYAGSDCDADAAVMVDGVFNLGKATADAARVAHGVRRLASARPDLVRDDGDGVLVVFTPSCVEVSLTVVGGVDKFIAWAHRTRGAPLTEPRLAAQVRNILGLAAPFPTAAVRRM